MRIVTIGKGLLFAALMIWALNACSGAEDDAETIRTLIKEAAEHAEDHSIKEIVELTTDDFTASPGDYTRTNIKRVLLFAFRHYGKFKVLYPRPGVDVDSSGNEAHARVHFMLIRQQGGIPDLKDLYEDPEEWLKKAGEIADLYRLDLKLRKDGGDWLVAQAHIEGFTGTGFGD